MNTFNKPDKENNTTIHTTSELISDLYFLTLFAKEGMQLNLPDCC